MEERINIFTYGSLMLDRVMSGIVKEKYQSTPATLKNYRRRKLADRRYPGVIPHEGESVNGLLYYSVSPWDTKVLDDFQCEYNRDPVKVVLQDGTTRDAYVYVIKDHSRMSETAWDIKKFEEEMGTSFGWLQPDQ